ncbi:MAG: hypothetical protein MUO68_00460, partial [Desulfobacteraceae bacterium]|nr:hypothetical protein [Desulfobacteraceae bacterium]
MSSYNGVIANCGQWVIVEIEDPAQGVCSRLSEARGGHHLIRRDIIAKRLNLQPPIAEEVFEFRTVKDIVSIYVATALHEDEAEPKVV